MTSTILSINNYEVEISHGYIFEQLENQWLDIQNKQDVPFFLTWAWISCWLKTYSPDILVVSASFKGELVSIGLLTQSIEKRHGVLKSRQFRLHQMGDQLLDQIWMEYNDFISYTEHRVPAVNACIEALKQSLHNWDEIIISMMEASRGRDVQSKMKNCHTLLRTPSYTTKIDSLSKGNNYLSSLKSNTRYQITRSLRLYKDLHGEINLTPAESTSEALDFFSIAGEYHKQRWSDSGFKNPKFILFHENLIKNTFAQNSVELIKITSGDTVIGVLYFHIVNKKVFFYLHGLKYEKDKKLKPGLVSHALATQYFFDRGINQYDYMGGYSQYKCQLATESEDMVSLCIQRPQLKFSLENMARKLKNLVIRSVQKEGGHSEFLAN